jgi:hypothetical protein
MTLEGLMAVTVKTAAAAAQKFITNAQAAAPAYATGVAGAGAKWAANTSAAADNWQQGVIAAASNGRFSAGVNNTSQTKYQTRSSGVGAQRYPSGVAGSQAAYQTAVTPYLQTIANLTLPPRQPKGSAANIQRVTAVANALRAQKLGTNA